MTEHRITITWKDNAAVLVPANTTLRIGDTVVYVTEPPDRPFRVEFPPSPFTSEPAFIIDDSYPRTVSQEGRFKCRCFITPPDGQEVGWCPDAPEAGGEHDVKP